MKRRNELLENKRNQLIDIAIIFVSSLFLLNGVFWKFYDQPVLMINSTITGLSLLCVLFIKKNLRTITLRTNIVLTISFISLCISIIQTYENSLILVFWLFLFPLGSLVFIDKKWFFFWSVLLFSFIVFLPYFSSIMPYKIVFPDSQINQINLSQLLTMLVAMFLFLFAYRELLYNILDTLQENRKNLIKKSDELKRNQEYKDHFFANISHELRTPMNAIKGISELLVASSEDNEELIEHLKNSSNHLLTIINDLLDFSKMKAGKLTITNVQFDLRETIYSSYNIVKVLAEDKKINYNLEIDSKLPQHVMGDPHRLTQIFVNILSNAAKYTPEGGVINFICLDKSTEEDDINDVCHMSVEINDSGIGISQEVMDKLFEDYYRSEETLNNNIAGTGLGLSITKNLVDAMNADITMESEEGKGTSVKLKFKFPKVNYIPDHVRLDHKSEFKLDLKMNILIVDDNHLNVVVAKKQLERIIPETSKIFTAKNGQIGIDILNENEIDIILMDMKMPVMNGVDATKAIRNLKDPIKSSVPIIAMTANVGENDIKACFESGMNTYISKPFEIYTLTHKIHKLLIDRDYKEHERIKAV